MSLYPFFPGGFPFIDAFPLYIYNISVLVFGLLSAPKSPFGLPMFLLNLFHVPSFVVGEVGGDSHLG